MRYDIHDNSRTLNYTDEERQRQGLRDIGTAGEGIRKKPTV